MNVELDGNLDKNHSIRSQFFSKKFSNENIFDEAKDEDQTPPELEKNMKNLRQSLNDLLHEAHSPDNDTFAGSKLAPPKRVSTALINRRKN
jgi:hypothetical protein